MIVIIYLISQPVNQFFNLSGTTKFFPNLVCIAILKFRPAYLGNPVTFTDILTGKEVEKTEQSCKISRSISNECID